MSKTKKTRKWYLRLNEILQEVENSNLRKEIVLGNFIFSSREDEGLPAPVLYPLVTRRLTIELGVDQYNRSIIELKPDEEEGIFNDSLLTYFAEVGFNPKAKEGLREAVIDAAGDLINGDDYEDLFRSFILKLHPRANWLGRSTSPSPDFPTEVDFLLYEYPILMLRDRVLGLDTAIDRIRKTIASSGKVPNHLQNVICECKKNQKYTDHGEETYEQRLAATAGEAPDILLAKAANKEQLMIARRIREAGSVVVQGPPGTGKTHTIANLIGHFLSEGKRILVTSQKTKALSVLKEKLPQSFRDLCVSRVSENQKEILDTATRFSERIESLNDRDEQRLIETLMAERLNLLNDLVKVRDAIFSQLNQEIGSISFDGESLSLTAVAKKLHEQDRLLALIPGRTIDVPSLPLSEEEYELLTKWRGSQQDDDIESLNHEIPALDRLMPVANFDAAIAELKNIESFEKPDVISNVVKRTDIKGLNTTTFQMTKGLPNFSFPTKNGNKIVEVWDGVKEVFTIFDDALKYPMINLAFIAGFGDKIKALSFEKLLNSMVAAKEAERLYKEVELDYEVNVANDCLKDQNWVESFIKFRNEAPNGQPSWLWKLSHGAICKKIEQVTVNGKIPNTTDAVNAVKLRIEMFQTRQSFNRLWDRLLNDSGVNELSAEDLDNNFEAIYRKYFVRLQNALTLKRGVVDPLIKSWREMGVNVDSLFNPAQDSNEKEQIEFFRKRFLPVSKAAMEIVGRETRRFEIDSLLNNLQNYLEPFGTTAVGMDLWLAVGERSEKYKAAYENIERLNELRTVYERWRIVFDKLSSAAPTFAERLKSAKALSENEPPIYSELSQAWRIKQLEQIYNSKTSTNLKSLQRKATDLSRKYRSQTEKLAAAKAWLAASRRLESEPKMLSSLKRAAQAMKRVGKGTGKMSAVHLQNAQNELRVGSGIVPVWIMTIDQALTSFVDVQSRFDLLIVDEASQADLTALPLLYLAENAIIVGDDKQVSPVSIGTKNEAVDALRRSWLTGRVPHAESYEFDMSLYDMVIPTMRMVRLSEHFRCVPSIIEFSNRLCYERKIQPLRHDDDTTVHPPFVIERVPGIRRENDENHEEAHAIASLMKACIDQPEYKGKTFGVIVMRSKSSQVRLIQNVIAQTFSADVIKDRHILCGLSAEFQGDERDVIFLSFVDSGDVEGKLLKKEGDRQEIMTKRYNVAVSRARDQVWLVHSFDWKTQLNFEDLRRKLFEHADKVLSGAASDEKIRADADPNSQFFEVPVAKHLKQLGYRIRQQEPVGNFRIDIAVFGTGYKRVALECDGDRYHSGAQKIEEDMRRQTVLERIGWSFIRLRGSEYFRDPEKAMNRVVRELEELGIYPDKKTEEDRQDNGDQLLCRVRQAAGPVTRGSVDVMTLEVNGAFEINGDPQGGIENNAPSLFNAEINDLDRTSASNCSAEIKASGCDDVLSVDNIDSLDKIENKTSSLKSDEPVDIDKHLAEGVSYIQKLRSLGWTHRQIADVVGISSGYVSQISNGITKPTAAVEAKLRKLVEKGLPIEEVTPSIQDVDKTEKINDTPSVLSNKSTNSSHKLREENYMNAVNELRVLAETKGWPVVDLIKTNHLFAVIAGEYEGKEMQRLIRSKWGVQPVFLPSGNYLTYNTSAWVLYRPRF